MATKSLSNVAVLTHENKIWSRKKKQKKEQVKEVLEFLTGFHKRKLARKEAGKAKALEKERQHRLEERRERRRELAERAAQNAKEIERSYGAEYNSDDENASASSSKSEVEDVQFENEEQLATVTVVDEFDPSTLGHMWHHTRIENLARHLRRISSRQNLLVPNLQSLQSPNSDTRPKQLASTRK
ncbi:SubName: Full=Uncharacterized protein {ECO:0000313/EMBL:CCA67463.1} [Serendipita indica DSM 11827]|nr:SubName: Full=Uncharacterized protein {ECO:0000313/EMBL:CCA67463.1} [Serendipita indica DSM 11827]